MKMTNDQKAPNQQPSPNQAETSAGNNKPGTLYYDTLAMKLPPGVLEEKPKPRRIAGMSPALIVIAILALAFIVGIALVISRME